MHLEHNSNKNLARKLLILCMASIKQGIKANHRLTIPHASLVVLGQTKALWKIVLSSNID